MAWNPTYKINLLSVLESSFSDSDLKEALRPSVADSAFKSLYGQRVVDEIVNRTREENIDKKGKSLGVYNDAKKKKDGSLSIPYKDSLIFKIYKSGQKKVDLTLTGEMLESLRSRGSKYEITIFLEGDNNRGKAQGHITGIYGDKGKSKPRDFLGLPKSEEIRIFQETMKDYASGNADVLSELAASYGSEI